MRYPAKNSPEKHTIPGTKQLFRFPDHDVLGLSTECFTGAEALLKPVILGGKVIDTLPDANGVRDRVTHALQEWPGRDRRTELSPKLRALVAQVRGADVEVSA
jgi:hypothetical protein